MPSTTGRLVVSCAGAWNRNQLGLERMPKLSINGQRLVTLRKGPTAFELPAGYYDLIVGIGMAQTNAFHYGKARIIAQVMQGHTTTVYYYAPYTVLSRGVIGLVPQRPPDRFQLGCLVAMIAVALVLTLLAVLDVL